MQADRRITKPSYVQLASTAVVSDCGAPVYTTDEVVVRGCPIVIGRTKYLGLQTAYSPAFEEAFAGLRSPGQLSFVVDGGTDTIPAPPSPGPFRSAFARGGEASLTSLLATAGLVITDTIPGPPSPFLLANAAVGSAMLVLSVDELAKKRVLAYSPNAITLEVIWTIKTALGPQTFIMAAALPPTDTIPSRGTDCGVDDEGC